MSNGKIGIFLPGANGDIGLATSVLKYKDVLWPGKDIVWFTSLMTEAQLGYVPFSDMLKFNDAISEIRHWPEGYALPERCIEENKTAAAKGDRLWADFSALKLPNGHLNQEAKHQFDSTRDLDEGYFPAPWLMPNRPTGQNYSEVSRMVCGVDQSWEWHPYLGFSDEEREMAKEFRAKLPHDRTVMIQNHMNSGNVHWSDEMTRRSMQICRAQFGKCNFIFATKRNNQMFFDDPGAVDSIRFTVRQNALLFNHCDFFIGVCSGISVAASCWGNKPVPRIEWCGSPPINYSHMANGPTRIVYFDDLPHAVAEAAFMAALEESVRKVG